MSKDQYLEMSKPILYHVAKQWEGIVVFPKKIIKY